MSLGNTYNNNANQKNDKYSPTIYSPYRMNNSESTVDKTCITYTFWNNMLKIGIFPKKNTGGDEVAFDMENGIAIYLNHTKARMFAEILRKFREDPEHFSNSGVPSGQGAIIISTADQFNPSCDPVPVLAIYKLDQDGNITTSFAYEFKHDYHYALTNFNPKGSTFDSDYESYSTLEIDQLITLLEEYYKATTCATAYTVVDNMKYDVSRMTTRLNKIAEKLGVELGGNGGGGNNRSYGNNSYFNRNSKENSAPATSYRQATLDDID